MSKPLKLDDDARWRYLQARKPSTAFVYAVKTTKIYCRSSCPSRLARRANVAFYDSSFDAQKAGFRACKRCKPDQTPRPLTNDISKSASSPNASLNRMEVDADHTLEPGEQNARWRAASRAKKVMEDCNGRKAWKVVAEEVGLSPRYLFDAFKAVEGVTPGVFAEKLRRTHQTQQSQVTSTSTTAVQSDFTLFNGAGNMDLSPTWDDFTTDELDAYILSLGSDRDHLSNHDQHVSWAPTEASLDSLSSGATANTPIQDLINDGDMSGLIEQFEWPLDPDLKVSGDLAPKFSFDDWTYDIGNTEESADK